MAFDIYGQNLRRGYCEVHPDVPETYPCNVCYDEATEAEYARRAEERAYERYCSRKYEEWLAKRTR